MQACSDNPAATNGGNGGGDGGGHGGDQAVQCPGASTGAMDTKLLAIVQHTDGVERCAKTVKPLQLIHVTLPMKLTEMAEQESVIGISKTMCFSC